MVAKCGRGEYRPLHVPNTPIEHRLPFDVGGSPDLVESQWKPTGFLRPPAIAGTGEERTYRRVAGSASDLLQPRFSRLLLRHEAREGGDRCG